jgi:AraC-like DNA-binding protein
VSVPVVAALLDSRGAHLALRRTLPAVPPAVHTCRSFAGLRRAYTTRLLDAVIVGARALREMDLPLLRREFPAIPVLAYGAFRPDDGAALLSLTERTGLAGILVQGVDDAMAGDLVRRHSLSAARARALAEAPRLLRLREPLQVAAWRRLVVSAGPGLTTDAVADALGVSREHLSRQFAAGGAPNLKRVIDLLRMVSAAQLLANPGYDLKTVAGLLGFGTVSHLNAMSRRVAGIPASDLGALTPMAVVTAFRRAGMRSRG